MAAKRKRPTRPKAPSGLDPKGRELWRAILGDLAEEWSLDQRELHLLARACVLADRAAELEKAIDRDGTTTTGSRGQVVVHPALTELRQIEIVRLRLLSALELSDPNAEGTSRPARAQARAAAKTRWREKRYG